MAELCRSGASGSQEEVGAVVSLAVASFTNVVEAASNERICPRGGSIGQTRGSLRIGCRFFLWKRSARNGGVLEKVLPSSARPHVDLVPGGNGTGTCLIDDPTCDRTRDCIRATRYGGRTIEHAT